MKITAEKLVAVDDAKALFEEAKDWGVLTWLLNKSRARQTADAAWEALERHEKQVKAGWPADVKKAFREDSALQTADAKAHQARLDAEAQFDEADRRLSTSMAREGAQMAIDAWTMREKFIRRLEAFTRRH